MNYPSSEDIFNQEKEVPFDDGSSESMEMDLDVPGFDLDDNQEEIVSEDEENNYWSLSDNEDDHEEQNDDIIN